MTTTLCKDKKQIHELLELSRLHHNEGIVLRVPTALYNQEKSSFKMEVKFERNRIILLSLRKQMNL